MAALVLVLAIFYSVISAVISADSFSYLIFVVADKTHCNGLNHLIWPFLVFSIFIAEKVFYWVIDFLYPEEKGT